MNLIESHVSRPSSAFFAFEKQARLHYSDISPWSENGLSKAFYAVSYIPVCVETKLISNHYYDESSEPELPKEETTSVVQSSCFGEFPLNQKICGRKDACGYSVYRNYIKIPKSVAVRVDTEGNTPELRKFLEIFRRKDTPWADMQDAVTFRECKIHGYTLIVADIRVDPNWALDQLLQLMIALKLYREDMDVVDTLLESIDDPTTFLYGAHPVFALAVGVSMTSAATNFVLRGDQWFVYPFRGDDCFIDWGNLNKPMKDSTESHIIGELAEEKKKNISYGLPCKLLECSRVSEFVDAHLDCIEEDIDDEYTYEDWIQGGAYGEIDGYYFTFNKILREDGVVVDLDEPINPQTLM